MFLHTVKNVEGCRNGSAQSKVQHGREWHATITRVIIVYVKGCRDDSAKNYRNKGTKARMRA